ncbi:MAG: YfiR/HmsC family protein [Sulfurimonas sp.]
MNASTYDDDILNIFSKMVPRFIIMSSQKDKIKEDLEICILHDKMDERAALSLINKINDDYPKGIQNFQIKLINSNYSELKTCKNAQLAFMFSSDDKNIEKAILFLNNENILSMSYDLVLLEKGADISLFIGRNVLPYINIKNITDKKITLDNILLRVSKIYMETNK